MIVPILLLLLSMVGIGTAVTFPSVSDLGLLAWPCAAASLFLVLRAYFTRGKQGKHRNNSGRLGKPRGSIFKPKYILLDGSNVMHWKDGTPQVETICEVVNHLKAKGFSPGVVFDANAGHILFGKYHHHGAMGKRIGLPEDRVMVVQKGTPADPTILAAARDLGARIVTNDRYADWSDTHPEVREPGRLIRGGYREGALWLDLDKASLPPPLNNPS